MLISYNKSSSLIRNDTTPTISHEPAQALSFSQSLLILFFRLFYSQYLSIDSFVRFQPSHHLGQYRLGIK